MIENAYEEGIEFYIQKPLNSVEAEKVIQTVSRNLPMQRTLQKMQNIFEDSVQTSVSPTPQKQKDYLPKLQKILQRLGIIGDAGSKDIITIIEYLIEEKEDVTNTTLHELCSHFTDSPKTMEQRIRRAAANGMVNLAHLGLEDYGNEIFTEYANSLYNFEQVRKEMDFIRGKTNQGLEILKSGIFLMPSSFPARNKKSRCFRHFAQKYIVFDIFIIYFDIF